MDRTTKLIITLGGILCVGLGVIGIFLPLLPTTPFFLLAAYLFSKSSSRFENWLLTHPKLGPPIADWRLHRAIRPRAKSLATLFMSASFFYVVLSNRSTGVKVLVGCVAVSVLIFIWTRNSGPR